MLLKKVGTFEIDMSQSLGEGTYGTVYPARAHGKRARRASDVVSSDKWPYAVKRMSGTEDEGLGHDVLREVQALKSLGDCENVARFVDVIVESGGNGVRAYVVMQKEWGTLSHYVQSQENSFVCDQTARWLAHQLFSALAYCHDVIGIIHRDVKPANILVSDGGPSAVLRLSDFNTARNLVLSGRCVTWPPPTTYWYRAPECLLGTRIPPADANARKCDKAPLEQECIDELSDSLGRMLPSDDVGVAGWSYGNEVDIWAAGCVLKQLMSADFPLFVADIPAKRGRDVAECNMLRAIFLKLGIPTEDSWPTLKQYSRAANSKGWRALCGPVRKACPEGGLASTLEAQGGCAPDVAAALCECLCYDPSSRVTASTALRTWEWFACFRRDAVALE